MKTTRQTLIDDIDAFIERHDMHTTVFSQLAMKDSAFLLRLKDGTEPSAPTIDKVRKFMAEYKGHTKRRPKSRSLTGAAA